MTAATTTPFELMDEDLELTHDDLSLTKIALESFMQDFGHDEADVRSHIRGVLAKVNSRLASSVLR